MRFLALLRAVLFSSQSFAQAASGSKRGAGTKNGRFQLIQLSDFRRDQYLLDTETGHMWQPVCSKDEANGVCNGYMYFTEVLVEGVNFTVPQPAPPAH